MKKCQGQGYQAQSLPKPSDSASPDYNTLTRPPSPGDAEDATTAGGGASGGLDCYTAGAGLARASHGVMACMESMTIMHRPVIRLPKHRIYPYEAIIRGGGISLI
jgi:hypothetical protein